MAPLPPLPANNTDRVFIQYTSQGEPHVMEARPDGLADAAAANAFAQDLSDIIRPAMTVDDSVYGGYIIKAGLTVSVPLTFIGGAGAQSAIGATDRNKASFVSFVGRSVGGYRVRSTLFTPAADAFTATRYAIGVVNTVFANIWSFITADTVEWTSKEGAATYWKSYVNFGWNSYFQRKGR